MDEFKLNILEVTLKALLSIVLPERFSYWVSFSKRFYPISSFMPYFHPQISRYPIISRFS